MPPRAAGRGGAGRGRSVSPTKGKSIGRGAEAPARTLKKRENKVDAKEEAERAEKERQTAREALLLQVKGILSRVTDGGEDEVDTDFVEMVETASNKVLAWIKTPIGDSSRKEEYAKKLPDVEKAFADAVALTKEKRAEPPLPYNIFHGDQIIITRNGRQLEAAIKGRDMVEVKRLLALQNGRAQISNKDPRGWTPLHYAISQGDVEIAKQLIGAGAEVNAETDDGTSCMHLACSAGREHMIEVLVASGAQTDIQVKETLWTPLHVASSLGSIHAAKGLLNAKADANAVGRGGWRPLHCAAMNGHADLAAILMMSRGVKGESLADPKHRLELLTGDGTDKVPGLTAAEVAKAHGYYETEEKIRATAMFVEQEADSAERARIAAEEAAKAEKEEQGKRGTRKGRSKSPTKALAKT